MMQSPDLKREFRELLETSGWSQAEAARQLGMTPSALSQIVRENSPVKPSAVTLRLFKLLLLTCSPVDAPAVPRRQSGMVLREKWEMDLITVLREAPVGAREMAIRLVDALIEPHLRQRASDGRRRHGR
jgi:hypothetical protein